MILANLGLSMVAVTCVVSAAFMAINNIYGWGWFLLVGVLCAGSVKFGKDEE